MGFTPHLAANVDYMYISRLGIALPCRLTRSVKKSLSAPTPQAGTIAERSLELLVEPARRRYGRSHK